MIKILFVCYGNICRSPMAEFLFKDYITKKGEAEKFSISSAATSSEELGEGVHYGTQRILSGLNIDCSKKRAIKLNKDDYAKYDYIIGMDSNNLRAMRSIFGEDNDKKISLLLDYTNCPRDVADPWYTRDFDTAYRDILLGLEGFYQFLQRKGR